MYATEYDLLVAEDRLRDRRDEMKSIRLAKAAQAQTTDRGSSIDRLLAFTARGALLRGAEGKAGAAA